MTYLDPSHTPPWCWRSEVLNRSYEALAAAVHRCWKDFAHWWHSMKKLCGLGCRGNVSSSLSRGQKLLAQSLASFPDDHLVNRKEAILRFICQYSLLNNWIWLDLKAGFTERLSSDTDIKPSRYDAYVQPILVKCSNKGWPFWNILPA